MFEVSTQAPWLTSKATVLGALAGTTPAVTAGEAAFFPYRGQQRQCTDIKVLKKRGKILL
jgi:hypothetical protein